MIAILTRKHFMHHSLHHAPICELKYAYTDFKLPSFNQVEDATAQHKCKMRISPGKCSKFSNIFSSVKGTQQLWEIIEEIFSLK